MKRFCCWICCFFLLISASALSEGPLHGYDKKNGYQYVMLGSYPQTLDGGNVGDANMAWQWKHQVLEDNTGLSVEKEPILWRILSTDDEKVYLLSEYILFAMPMHEAYAEYKAFKGEFASTDLCRYLNNVFLPEAFTAEEQAAMLENGEFGRIFLLSSDELKDKSFGFTGNKARKAWATEYAVRVTGAFVYQKSMGCCSPYWTRTRSSSAQAAGRAARCTKQDGSIGFYNTSNPEEGVRPAVFLARDRFEIAAGSGTKEDPYLLQFMN